MGDLDVVRRVLLGDLARRYPGLAHLHEDLASEAIADLVRWQAEREQKLDQTSSLRVGRRILQRRMADHFRSKLREGIVFAPALSQRTLTEQSMQVRRLAVAVLDMVQH